MTESTSSPSRRDFLKASTATAASLAFLPNAHAKGNDTIKVGLIGCGGRGTGAADNICEASGTTYNIKIHALADVFQDRLRDCRDSIRNSEHGKEKFDVADDRCFVGFDAYQKVIDCCDLVMLATPPGFRPLHIEAVIKAGKNLFTEKPVGVDPTGIRKVLAAYEEAKNKKLAVVAGTQRRHEVGYIESMKLIHEGAIGEITSSRVSWNQGSIWANKRQAGWSDTEYQLRNWYRFVWLCGNHIVEQHVHKSARQAGRGVAQTWRKSARKPACSKWWSPVKASVRPRSVITAKEMQSVSDQALSRRLSNRCSPRRRHSSPDTISTAGWVVNSRNRSTNAARFVVDVDIASPTSTSTQVVVRRGNSRSGST